MALVAPVEPIFMHNKKLGDQFDGGNSAIQFVSFIWIHEDEFCKASLTDVSQELEANQAMGSS